MNHNKKKTLARRHMTPLEIKEKVPIFQTKWWENRKESRQIIAKKSQIHKNETKEIKIH